MKLQIDQLDSFDQWLTQTRERISTELENVEQDLPAIDRQLKQLVELQDEITTKQSTVESLQTMIISPDSPEEIRLKSSDITKRWTDISELIRNHSTKIQETKTELEKSVLNRQESPIFNDNNKLQQDFDSSARKFLDWIDSIETILEDKQDKIEVSSIHTLPFLPY